VGERNEEDVWEALRPPREGSSSYCPHAALRDSGTSAASGQGAAFLFPVLHKSVFELQELKICTSVEWIGKKS
jgi:hypothetical protein